MQNVAHRIIAIIFFTVVSTIAFGYEYEIQINGTARYYVSAAPGENFLRLNIPKANKTKYYRVTLEGNHTKSNSIKGKFGGFSTVKVERKFKQYLLTVSKAHSVQAQQYALKFTNTVERDEDISITVKVSQDNTMQEFDMRDKQPQMDNARGEQAQDDAQMNEAMILKLQTLEIKLMDLKDRLTKAQLSADTKLIREQLDQASKLREDSVALTRKLMAIDLNVHPKCREIAESIVAFNVMVLAYLEKLEERSRHIVPDFPKKAEALLSDVRGFQLNESFSTYQVNRLARELDALIAEGGTQPQEALQEKLLDGLLVVNNIQREKETIDTWGRHIEEATSKSELLGLKKQIPLLRANSTVNDTKGLLTLVDQYQQRLEEKALCHDVDVSQSDSDASSASLGDAKSSPVETTFRKRMSFREFGRIVEYIKTVQALLKHPDAPIEDLQAAFDAIPAEALRIDYIPRRIEQLRNAIDARKVAAESRVQQRQSVQREIPGPSRAIFSPKKDEEKTVEASSVSARISPLPEETVQTQGCMDKKPVFGQLLRELKSQPHIKSQSDSVEEDEEFISMSPQKRLQRQLFASPRSNQQSRRETQLARVRAQEERERRKRMARNASSADILKQAQADAKADQSRDVAGLMAALKDPAKRPARRAVPRTPEAKAQAMQSDLKRLRDGYQPLKPLSVSNSEHYEKVQASLPHDDKESLIGYVNDLDGLILQHVLRHYAGYFTDDLLKNAADIKFGIVKSAATSGSAANSPFAKGLRNCMATRADQLTDDEDSENEGVSDHEWDDDGLE